MAVEAIHRVRPTSVRGRAHFLLVLDTYHLFDQVRSNPTAT